MTVRKRFLTVLFTALAALAAVPSLAAAINITVDDNRVECPVADYTSLPAAVAAAANGDTVHVCAGTYNVPGGPAPSSGLKIEKNISIEGAGASKVFVQPTAESAPMYQNPANPRDEYGNVITIRRRLIELYEVSISGLTVRSYTPKGTGSNTEYPIVPAEAGIAMIDVDVGKISGVRVEGLVPSPKGSSPVPQPGTGVYAPGEPLATQGQGIVVANTIEDTDNVTTITGSEVKGFNATGILVDNRLLGGSASVGNNSHMTARIVNTKVTGAGGTPPIAQTGVEGWGSGTRVQITKSRIGGVGKADGSAAAVALHGADVPNSVVGGADPEAVNLTGNAYGATNVAYDGSAAASSLNATHDFWGTTVSGETPLAGPGVDYLPVLAAAPAEPALAPVVDALPTLEWDSPRKAGTVLTPGQPVHLAAVAGDDFGVRQVAFKVSGGTVGISPTPALTGERVYSFDWTPTAANSGANRVISAVATDGNGLVGEVTTTVDIPGPPRLSGAAGTIGGKSGVWAAVGKPLTCEGGDASYPAATLSYEWTSEGAPVGTGPTYTPTPADQGTRIVCTVTAQNGFGSVAQSGGPVEVGSLPVFDEAATLGGFSGALALAGDVLTCSAAASGEPEPALSFSWLRDGAPIPGATGTEYTVAAADGTHTVSCSAEATSLAGTTTSVDPVDVGAAPSGGAATIAGPAKVGSALHCSSSPWTALPAAAVSYSWLRDGAPIAGAAGPDYLVAAADAGSQIACRATASNELGAGEATSAAVKALAAPPSVSILGGGPKKLRGSRAKLGTVSCDVGPCAVTVPPQVKVKIGGKRYTATVVLPPSLASGESAPILVQLGKAAKQALKTAGKSGRFELQVGASGGGGSAAAPIATQLT